MSKIYATCGHEVTERNEVAHVEEVDQIRQKNKGLSYPCLCWQCLQEHISWGIIKRVLIKNKWYKITKGGKGGR